MRKLNYGMMKTEKQFQMTENQIQVLPPFPCGLTLTNRLLDFSTATHIPAQMPIKTPNAKKAMPTHAWIDRPL